MSRRRRVEAPLKIEKKSTNLLKGWRSDVRVDCSNNQIKFRSPRLMVQRTKSLSSTSLPALANAKARD